MTIEQWLSQSTSKLDNSATPRLDVEVLAAHVLQKDRAWLLARFDAIIPKDKLHTLESLLARRSNHEPIAYIIGKQEFYGREFLVNHHVLVPRPESETMIELALKHRGLLKSVIAPHIVDVGSGSGALGITLALEMNVPTVDFVDIDRRTLNVAKDNAKTHGVNGKFLHSDLLNDNESLYDIVLANLPYVPNSHTINDAAMIEPRIAIFGGEDGLDLYRQLFMQISRRASTPALLLTESLPPQHEELLSIASDAGFKLLDSQDFIQVFVPL